MPGFSLLQMTESDLEDHLNHAKDVLLEHLASEEVISGEEAENLMKTKVIILKQPSAISRLYNKLLGKRSKELLKVVATVPEIEL
jgi:hypothetical protein